MGIKTFRLSAGTALVGLFLSASPAWAVFELSAQPQKGGRSLRFDAGLSSQGPREEELTLTADTDQAVPYRIYATLLSPLRDEQGRTLPADALYLFSPTNALGDLRAKLEAPLRLGQTLLYTSNSAGDADHFTFVFHLNLPENLPGGVYRSSLTFTMEPSTPAAGLTPQTATLELRAEARPAFHFSVRGTKGERLDLGRLTQKGPPSPAILEFRIESNIGQPYRIFQELRPMVSEAGAELPEEAVAFSVEGAGAGKPAPAGRLSAGPVLMYESDALGSGVRFQAAYQAEPPAGTAAGRSTGTILFRVESASPHAAGQMAQLPVLFEIDPIFNLEIDIPDGMGLQFGSLRSGEEAPEKNVFLNVRSNMRQPYQISQLVARKMSTSDGSALPENAFRYAVQKPATGTTPAVAWKPVPPGESLLFLSDSSGTPERLICAYALSVPREAKSGPYGTEIKYSITTL